jgi:hypothetical protein
MKKLERKKEAPQSFVKGETIINLGEISMAPKRESTSERVKSPLPSAAACTSATSRSPSKAVNTSSRLFVH